MEIIIIEITQNWFRIVSSYQLDYALKVVDIISLGYRIN